MPIQNSKDAVQEWHIPYEDLKFKEVVKRGRFGDIYRYIPIAIRYAITSACQMHFNMQRILRHGA